MEESLIELQEAFLEEYQKELPKVLHIRIPGEIPESIPVLKFLDES